MRAQSGLVLLPVLVLGGKCSANTSAIALLDRTIQAVGGLESLEDVKQIALQSS